MKRILLFLLALVIEASIATVGLWYLGFRGTTSRILDGLCGAVFGMFWMIYVDPKLRTEAQ